MNGTRTTNERRSVAQLLATAAGIATAIAIVGSAFAGGNGGQGGQNGNYDPDADDAIQMQGMLRDFRPAHQKSGHPDMEVEPIDGMAVYMGAVDEYLDADGKPVYMGSAQKVVTNWMNSAGEPIHPSAYDAALGDSMGSFGASSTCNVDSVTSFRQWFRDAPNVNNSAAFPITLHRDESSGNFVFDDRLDTHMAEVFGGGNKNRNFTYEAETVVTYLQGAGQKFKFSADDDLWVYIDGRLVVDLGGCHENQEQVLELDRLDWLVDTENYTMKIFYANRLKNTARLRIETNGLLLPGSLPGTWGQYD